MDDMKQAMGAGAWGRVWRTGWALCCGWGGLASAWASAPAFTAAPANQIVAAGANLLLSATVSGTAPLDYQWYKQGRLLIGATNSTLSLPNAVAADSGLYTVVVTNAEGFLQCRPAWVMVGMPLLVGWGDNAEHALARSGSSPSTPVLVATNVPVAAAGGGHALWIDKSGVLWSVGYGHYGELGKGLLFADWSSTPLSVSTNVQAVAAGSSHSLFLDTNGFVWAMGANSYGQLGLGTTLNVTNPARVVGLSNVVAMSGGNTHSLFLRQDGTAWSVGDNSIGQLADGTTVTRSTVAVVPGLSNVVAIATGNDHSLFLKRDGTLWVAGQNDYGQLGDGTTTSRSQLQCLASNVTCAVGGAFCTFFITRDGSLWATGVNDYGTLGDGTTTRRYKPVLSATNVQAVCAGQYHALSLDALGVLRAVGSGPNGQLGNGATTNSAQWVQVSGLRQMSLIQSADANFSMVLGAAPPQFSALSRDSAGTLAMSLSLLAGFSYRLEAATNLANPAWQPVLTNTPATSGFSSLSDTNASGTSQRFYRARRL